MSCVFAIALPGLAFIAADTRLNLGIFEGQRLFHDEGDVEITDQAGRILYVGRQQRKLRRTGFGWAAGVGNFLSLKEALDTIARLTTPGEILQKPLALNGVREVVVATIHHDGETYHTLGYDFRTQTPINAQYLFLTPPELDANIRTGMTAQFAPSLATDGDIPALCQNLRFVANLFHAVHANTTSVSDRIEIGIIKAGPPSFQYLQEANERIRTATDETLQCLLQFA